MRTSMEPRTICQLKMKNQELIEMKNPDVIRKIGLVFNYLNMMDKSDQSQVPVIPIETVSAKDMKFIIRQIEGMLESNEITKTLSEECEDMTNSEILSIVEITNFMGVQDLLDVMSKLCATRLETKNIEETAEFLNIDVNMSERERKEITKKDWFKNIELERSN